MPTYSVSAEVSVPVANQFFRGRPFYRLAVVITEVTGFLDKNLFVMQRIPLADDDYRDEFVGVAGPVDLLDYTTTPDERLFLRTDTYDVLFESHRQYAQLLAAIENGLQELVEGMKRLDQMQTVQTIEVA